MAVPKKKTSLHKRKLRRGQLVVPLRAHSICPNCGSDKHPHHVCLACGFYKGKQFLKIENSSGLIRNFRKN